MCKLFWLTSLAICYCMTAAAQQPPVADSAVLGLHATDGFSDSLFTDFSCVVKENSRVLIQWKADQTGDDGYFIVEHSNDGYHFETLGALKVAHNAPRYELTDNAAYSGSNFYRIRYTGKDEPVYSRTVQIIFSQASSFRFYPNPVDKLLIIQTDHSVNIQIINSVGAVRLTKSLQPGVQVINVSTLEKGNYLLRVIDRESNRDMLEQLLKN
jgi:hypothetical protein